MARPGTRLALAAALLVGVVAGACSSASPPAAGPGGPGGPGGSGGAGGAPAAGSAGPGGSLVRRSPPASEVASFAPGPCPFGRLPDEGVAVRVDCGVLTTVEDHFAPDDAADDGRRVQLAVARVHSPDPAGAKDPVLYLEGGPGGSALSGIEQWVAPLSPIVERHDLVLVDPRGTGYSQPRLTCDPEYDAAADEDDNPTILRRCHRRLADTGIAFERYDTSQTAADLLDLRVALGIDRWDLYGVSYGTRLALALMDRDPDGTASAVLDSVYPPGVESIEEDAPDAWAAIRQVLDACAQAPGCAADHPDLETKLVDVVTELDRRPVTIQAEDDEGAYEVDEDGQAFVDDLFSALSVTEALVDIPEAIDLAAAGDIQGASDLLLGIVASATGDEPRGPDGTEPPAVGPDDGDRPDDTDGLFYAIECRETAPAASHGDIDAAAERADIPDALRDPLTASSHAEIDDCASFEVAPRALEPVASDVPTLLLAGTADPLTPPRWAHEAARTLSRSEVVELPGVSHGVIDGGDCPSDLILTFLADPTARVGPRCTPPPLFR